MRGDQSDLLDTTLVPTRPGERRREVARLCLPKGLFKGTIYPFGVTLKAGEERLIYILGPIVIRNIEEYT